MNSLQRQFQTIEVIVSTPNDMQDEDFAYLLQDAIDINGICFEDDILKVYTTDEDFYT